MKRQSFITTAVVAASLSLGVGAEALAQQRQQQSQSSQGERQRVQLQLPGAETILKIDAEVPEEVRIGAPVDYSIRIQNVSDNVVIHNLKLEIKPQDGVTIESAKLTEKNQESGQGKDSSSSQQKESQKANQASQKETSQDGKKSSQNQQSQNKKQNASADDGRQVTIEQLQPGQTRTISISTTAEKEGQAMACVMVTEFAPALCLTTNAVKPELEIAKRAPEKAHLCEPIEFEYFVKNSGSGDLETFEVTDKLPQGLETESGDDHLTFKVDGGLKAGDVRKFVATLQATKAGEYSSRAVAKTADGKTTRSSKTTTKVEQAQLAIAIDGPQTAIVDQPVSYQIRVTNRGNIPSENARLRMTYPAIARFSGAGDLRETSNHVQESSGNSQPMSEDDASSNKQESNSDKQGNKTDQTQQDSEKKKNDEQDRNSREWELGSLEPDQTKQIRVTLSPNEAKQLRTVAIAEYGCAAGAEDRITSRAMVTTEIIAVPALLLTVIDNEQERDPDGMVTYKIEVRNQGTAADEQIEISAKLPQGLKFVKGSGHTKVTNDGQQLKIEPVKSLKPNDRAGWQIEAKTTADQQKQVQFRVDLNSKSLDSKVTAEEPTTLLPASSATSAVPSESSQN